MSCLNRSILEICLHNASSGVIDLESVLFTEQLPTGIQPLARVVAHHLTEKSLVIDIAEKYEELLNDYLALIRSSHQLRGVRATDTYYEKLEKIRYDLVNEILRYFGYWDMDEKSVFYCYESDKRSRVNMLIRYLRFLFACALNSATEDPTGLSPEILIESMFKNLPPIYRAMLFDADGFVKVVPPITREG